MYINYPDKEPNFTTVSEALASLAPVQTAPQSFPAVREDNITPVILHIAPGIYEEPILVERPYVTFLGEDAVSTVLTYHLGAYESMPDGSRRGTFRTASVRINTHDFTAKNITFANNAGFGHTVGQALALYADGDRLIFEDCRLISSQDTLFTAPLPPTAAKPGGFTGPGEAKPRIMGRHLYRHCYLQGDVDFIFGSAVAYFEACTIYSKKPGDRKPPESPDEETIYGYITAASTPEHAPFGYVFKDCRLLSDCPPHSVYLGRPWREWAKTVYLNCEMGAHIHPLGWNDWNKPHGHFYYAEYHSTGKGACPEKRADFSHQLTDEEAAAYTMENVLAGPDGWHPVLTKNTP
ncbi:MAG: pectinesterase family protein [Lachnospiraceae bacterium]